MLRGEVWWVDFDPSLGGEIQKMRPAVIVSNDSSNRNVNRIQVVPKTAKLGRRWPIKSRRSASYGSGIGWAYFRFPICNLSRRRF